MAATSGARIVVPAADERAVDQRGVRGARLVPVDGDGARSPFAAAQDRSEERLVPELQGAAEHAAHFVKKHTFDVIHDHVGKHVVREISQPFGWSSRVIQLVRASPLGTRGLINYVR